jgi:hypothetical protein
MGVHCIERGYTWRVQRVLMLLLALAKWKFEPGMLDGQPVDVVFNLTVDHRN